MSSYLREAIDGAANVEVMLETEVVDGEGEGGLERLTLRDASGSTASVAADALFVLIGARPGTEWLPEEVERDEWGYVLTGGDAGDEPDESSVGGGIDAKRSTRASGRQMLETSLPGVFAVGDVRHGCGQARRLGRRRGLDRDPAGAPVPRRERRRDAALGV